MLITNPQSDFKNQNSRSNMAVKNFKNCSIFMRIRIHWVFGSLISNKLSDFRNSKWLIQYSGSKFRKIFHFYENVNIKIFGDADYESVVRFKFNQMNLDFCVRDIESAILNFENLTTNTRPKKPQSGESHRNQCRIKIRATKGVTHVEFTCKRTYHTAVRQARRASDYLYRKCV